MLQVALITKPVKYSRKITMPVGSKALSRKKPAPRVTVSGAQETSWKSLAKSLSVLGLKRGYLADVIMPSWWTGAVAEDRNGFLETVALVHRRTGLPLESLLAGDPQWKAPGHNVKFKKTVGLKNEDVQACHQIAWQAAEAVAAAAPGRWTETLPAVDEIHATLKDRGKGRWVELEDVVAWCWKQGIPVIHVANFPRDCSKPDGMAVRTRGGRPVIILCKNSQRPAWQIFTLAHELGHIALGHVPEGGAVVDIKLETNGEEKEESGANRYAVSLLTGQPDFGMSTSGEIYPDALAVQAREFGRRNRISPGVVALNWGFTTKHWSTANGAVKILEEQEDALEMIHRAGATGLDWDEISPDAAEWLDRMAGLRPPP